MVVDNASSLFELLSQFDPNNPKHFDILEELIEKYPNFHLIKAYYLKAVQKLKPENFDKTLSYTSISTYEREILYEFIETPFNNKSTNLNSQNREDVFDKQKNQKDDEENPDIERSGKVPEVLTFSDWVTYLKKHPEQKKNSNIDDKFHLINSFLSNKEKKFDPQIPYIVEDLSEKSWIATDELMTETLAKVFVKQKKYDKALEAYQILGLKYPEKNSFFALRIKEIKKLRKLKD
tara:strand:- start:331 stop:1035 length:705 start_codon:yes stop_codon:yes gene_type:complete